MRFPGLDRLCRNINDTCLHLRPLRQNLQREFLVFFVHPLGNVTKICYNIFNAPVSVTDANGIVTKYAYNDAGKARAGRSASAMKPEYLAEIDRFRLMDDDFMSNT